MVDFGKSDKMIKITEKVDQSNTFNGFVGGILFFIHCTIYSIYSLFYLFLSHIYIYVCVCVCVCARARVCMCVQ